MAYLQGKAEKENTYDAIVVGTGISGGWAAKELTEKGLKTLVLERGPLISKHPTYPTSTKKPWELPYGDRPTEQDKKDYPKQLRTGYTIRQSLKHWWVKDTEHPYTEEKPFDWIRGYHVGGRSLLWGRQSYRLSPMDFEANAKEGIAVDWPIRYKDLAKWYDYVEEFAGINGRKDGLKQLPDGNFLPPMDMTCLEDHISKEIAKNFNGRVMTIGRSANITEPNEWHKKVGRGKCQYRNLCMRGCPFGGYFSSNSATLPAAAATGNMTLQPDSIVVEVLYDKDKKRATGVLVQDRETGNRTEYHARIVFLNASAFNSTWLLMNSATDVWEGGLGSSSGELGHNVMDHHFKLGARGTYDGFEDKYYKGRRPNGIYIPRYVNLPWDPSSKRDYLRGFGYQGRGSRDSWMRGIKELELIGDDLKNLAAKPGPWQFGMTAFGECLPYHDNHIRLNKEVLDIHGLPTLTMSAEWKENEYAMRKDMKQHAVEMLEAAGLRDVEGYEAENPNPGLGIHEMGTARMGRDSKTSVLNGFNQVWDAQNVFVTDGACMTSAGCQNPSLTYMAMTARAADHAVKELNKQNL